MLPEGWETSTVGAHTEVLTGFAFKSEDYISSVDGMKLLRGDNVGQGRLRWRDVKRYPQSQAANLARYELQAGDFVIAMDRTWIPAGVKISEVCPHDLPCLLVQRVARLRTKPSLRQDLLRQFFAGHRFEQFVKGVQTETAVPHISPNDVKSFEIALPPLPEQRKIAEILSTWDAAIGVQERLIANAKRQKKALMQTLLPTNTHPPKKRLPGFSEEWRSVCLGDIGKLRKGKGIQRDQVRASGFPCIRYGEIYTQHHEQVRQFHSFIDAKTAAESEPISAGDILFTCSGETAEEIGKCVAYLGNEKAYAGGDIIILSPTTANAAFLSYVLNDTAVTEQKRRFGQGNSVVHISAANLAKLTFKLPDQTEQDAIASILDVATDHIGRLEAALTTLAQEKSALMQQLLTGKRRVRVEELTA